MKILLDNNQLNNFPGHDANLYSFLVDQENEGTTNVILKVKITDNSYDPGYKIPKKNGMTQLVFSKCWYVKYEAFCDKNDRDSIFSLDLLNDSKQLIALIKQGVKVSIKHFQLRLNSGSQIDIVAEKLFLE